MNEFSFDSEFSSPAYFEWNGNVYHGVLKFGKRSDISFSLNNGFKINKVIFKSQDVISCYDGYNRFYLGQCSLYGDKIYAEYIVVGLTDEIKITAVELNINSLHCVINGVSYSGAFCEEGYCVPCNVNNFDVSIEDHDEVKRVYDRWDVFSNIKNIDGYSVNVLQRHIIRLDAVEYFEIPDVDRQVNFICSLFSTLTLLRLDISYVWLISEDDGKEKKYPFYFLSDKLEVDKEDKYNWVSSFLNLSMLDGSLWAKIFNGAYSNVDFKRLCPRFSGMLSYDGYWEFDVLGFVSIFDAYLASKVTEKNNKLPNSLRHKLNEIISNLDPDLHFESTRDREEYLRIKDKLMIFSSRNMTLQDRYVRFMNSMDFSAKKAIGLNSSDFHEIKKIRDDIAHMTPGLDKKHKNFKRIFEIRDKLIISICYFFLKDFNFSEEEFAHSVIRSVNPIKIGSGFENKWLRRVVGEIFSIKVRRGDIDKIMHGNYFGVVLVRVGDVFHYNDNLNFFFKDNYLDNIKLKGKSNDCDFIESHFCKDDFEGYQCKHMSITHAYFDDEFVEVNNVYLIDRSFGS
ncbi:hypothetical protein [Dickeya sp. ws52]|uniref:HEPN domain-containing protein n=1 Tax=Dickeya sp. ws52 TaxID=2576377 RepID=UPI00117E351B|nr:hypothetical protein [Dickeya sp. ws52]TYL43012.1 hypothetical protein FDP13_09875 [Dickeya sp. ws52]